MIKEAMAIRELLNILDTFPVDTPLTNGEDIGYKIHDVCSWRGVYREPAIVMEISNEYYTSTVGEFQGFLLRLLNETFVGWKGGDFEYVMDDTPWAVDDVKATTVSPWEDPTGIHIENVDGNLIMIITDHT